MSQPLKGAMVGYGWIARHGHAPWYQRANDVRIVAVADPTAACRAQARSDFPGAHTYASAQALLDAHPDLDFVDICTPPRWHAELAIAALDRGVHVLCEKPLATSSTQAEAMRDAAVRNHRVLMPCHTYRYAPVVQQVRTLLAEQRIGRVHLVTQQTFRNTHAKGIADWQPDWRRDRAIAGGGIAMDHGSHTFYLALEWLDALPTAVTAHLTTRGPWDTEDNYACTLTFPNGGLAMAQLTWTAGLRRVHYTLHGEWGAITVQDDGVEVALMGPPLPGGNGALTWRVQQLVCPSDWMDASHGQWFGAMFGQFQAAMQAGDVQPRDLLHALACVRIIEASYRSAARDGAQMPLELFA